MTVTLARKNRRVTLPQVTENVNAGRDQTVSNNKHIVRRNAYTIQWMHSDVERSDMIR